MLEFEFTILDWAAYAADLTGQPQWLEWAARAPALPPVDPQAAPPLSEMPAMMRRRLNRLGRMACQVAWWCQQQPAQTPMVFASRYGDLERSLELLGEVARGEPLSPTAFGLSVHNAFSALYGIARGHTGNAIAVAAGRATVGAALTEAAALLADGAPEVLVVYCDTPLAGRYADFRDEDPTEYAWCWRIAAPQAAAPGRPRVRLRIGTEAATSAPMNGDIPPNWPSGLAVLRHVLRQMDAERSDAELSRQDRAGTRWNWSVDHA